MGKTLKRMTNWFVALSIYYYSLAWRYGTTAVVVCRSLDFTDDEEDLGLPKSLQNSPGKHTNKEFFFNISISDQAEYLYARESNPAV